MIEKHAPEGGVVKHLEECIELAYKIVPPTSKNLTFEQFINRPLPPHDIPKTSGGANAMMLAPDDPIIKTLEKVREMLGYDYVSNYNIMAPNTQMPWHTNSNAAGWRLYYIKGAGAFKYLDENGEQQIDHDNDKGWTVRKFRITNDPPLWHSVYAKEKRYAFGFATVG